MANNDHEMESLRSLIGAKPSTHETGGIIKTTTHSEDIRYPEEKISKWPKSPQKLPGLLKKLGSTIIDLILLIICLLFFAFAVAASRSNGKVLDQHREQLLDIARYATTIFPYLFAAVVGRFLKAIAKWRLESRRGMSLGTLNFLLTSNTITNAFQASWTMRTFDWIALMLCALWALSPVGSQASLRVLSRRQGTISSYAPISWPDTTSPWPYFNPVTVIQQSEAPNIAYSSAMLSSSVHNNSNLDIYNNIKLPLLEANSNPTSGGWEKLGNSTQYSSLLGLPINAGAMQGNSSFIISNVTYWYSNCYNSTITYPGSEYTQSSRPFTNYSSWYNYQIGTGGLWQIAIKQNLSATFYQAEPQTWTNDSWRLIYGQILPNGGPVDLVFEQIFVSAETNYTLNHFDCHLTTSAIDLMVNCTTASGCESTAARFNPISHKPNTFWSSADNFYSFISQRDTGYNTFINEFANAVPNNTDTAFLEEDGFPGSTAFEWYLQDPSSNPFGNAYDAFADLSGIPAQTVGWRLSQLMNSYWLASMAPLSIVSNDWNEARDVTNSSLVQIVTQENGRTISTDQIYVHCDNRWLAALVLAIASLFLGTLLTIALKFLSKGPDILDFVSTLTRKNDFEFPTGGTFLDGDERARLLKRMRVKLGDDKADESVGSVMLGRESGKSILKNGRLYE